MKYPKILLFLGIWFTFIPLLALSTGFKKILLVIPGLFLIAIAITAMRAERANKNNFSLQHDELIQELAQDIAEDIVQESDEITHQEVKKLRDIL
jgi:uncharacterized membrane protein